jgi:hypothetical protein
MAITHVFDLGDTAMVQDSCQLEMLEFVAQKGKLIGQQQFGLLYEIKP